MWIGSRTGTGIAASRLLRTVDWSTVYSLPGQAGQSCWLLVLPIRALHHVQKKNRENANSVFISGAGWANESAIFSSVRSNCEEAILEIQVDKKGSQKSKFSDITLEAVPR